MNSDIAEKFSKEWVNAWNSHDIDKILSHYTDDFEMSSPIITRRMGVKSGKLKGKNAVGEYWALGLKRNPNLHFKLISVSTGVNSIVINYKGHQGNSSEIFYLDDAGKVYKADAHYGNC